MKVVAFVNWDAHRKNKFGFKQMCTDMGFEYLECNQLNEIPHDTDLIWSDNVIIPPHMLPEKTKIVFGPGLFIFPQLEHRVFYYDYKNKGYLTCLSPWVQKAWYEFITLPRIDIVAYPFPVDMKEFCPKPDIPKTNDVLVYFKQLNPDILKKAISYLDTLNLSYQVFEYGSYTEKDYREILAESKMCLWMGRHESQGFGFQECLSMNVPIVILDVKSMFEEYGYRNGQGWYIYEDKKDKYNLYATAASYWDDRCGIKTYDIDLIPELVKEMLGNLDKYKPREFIKDTLSSEACWKHWSSCLKNLS